MRRMIPCLVLLLSVWTEPGWSGGPGDGAHARPFVLQARSVPGRLRAVRVRDVNADGVKDLVYVAVEAGRREMGYFRGRKQGGFDAKPAHRLRLKRDVVLVGLGDMDPAPGVEFVLFGPHSVFAYRHAIPDEAQRYRRLFRETLFFPFSDPENVPVWPYVCDLDGDGLDDLCVPAWAGYVMRFQSRAADKTSSFEERHAIGARVGGRAEQPPHQRLAASISFSGHTYGESGDEGTAPAEGFMVASRRFQAAPVLVDENHDGRLDLLLVEGDHLRVWHQREDRAFPAKPDVDHDIEALMDRTPDWAPSGNVVIQDVDGDGRLDYLLRQGMEKNLRTRILFFSGGAQALTRAPSRIIVLKGLSARLQLRDVNGDGRLDLLVPTFRIDLLDAEKKAAVRSLEVALHVFLNRPEEGFPARPDFTRTGTLRTERLAEAGLDPLVFLDGDFNRDGKADLLVLEEDNHLAMYLSTETTSGLFSAGGSFTYQDQPAVRVAVPASHAVCIVDQKGDGVAEVILLHERGFTVGGWGLEEESGR
jgi:VCBS repeat protein